VPRDDVRVICSSLIGDAGLGFSAVQLMDAGQNAGLRAVDDACLMRQGCDAVMSLA
jgi:hypothetical protein